MITTLIAIVLALIVVPIVFLGGLSVWFRDGHDPTWIPPEPDRIHPRPFPYDWAEHERADEKEAG